MTPRMPSSLSSAFKFQPSTRFALILAVILLAVNIGLRPSFGSPANWAATVGTFAPFAIAAMASTPAIVSGGGGIDLSIGPLMTMINILFVKWMLPHSLGAPVVAIPIMVVLGLLAGTTNGLIIAYLRYPPVITTLSVNFILTGLALEVAPLAVSAPTNWTINLAQSVGPIPGGLITMAVPIAIWLVIKRTPYYRTLFAVGADEVAAYSAGVNVARVRILAYTLGGAFAGVGAIAVTALLQDADPTQASQYTLLAIAAVALGGTTLTGGRGSLRGSILGAASIYLLQNVLTVLNVPATWLSSAYGTLLLVAVIIGALALARRARREALA